MSVEASCDVTLILTPGVLQPGRAVAASSITPRLEEPGKIADIAG
jgi:hypothetical protein